MNRPLQRVTQLLQVEGGSYLEKVQGHLIHPGLAKGPETREEGHMAAS